MALCLGRKAIRLDSRRLMLSDYLPSTLPAPPAECDWTAGRTDWGMMLNDRLGCCTIAGVGHAIQVWEANNGNKTLTFDDDVILQYYEQWDGFNPSDPYSDQGGIEADVLTDWRNTNFFGHQLLAFADTNCANTPAVMQTINLFGVAYTGVSLPLTAQDQVGSTWDVVEGSAGARAGSWGGHCVVIPAYDPDGLDCITWGKKQRMTWKFFNTYFDEVHPILSPEWIASTGLSPSQFNLAQLTADLAAIR